ncbi:MAG: diadenylate cyclase CdaA [Oscillospiraceae bacterium]|nr:diadenylate cyclase CdaA [Oscillospiraceae bacterium]
MTEYLGDITQRALKYLSMTTFKDLIDVLVVAVILYILFRVLRRTTAMRILKSVAALLLTMAVAEVFSFQVLAFLLENTFQVGLIAVIILFQPELRRFLEQMGGTSFQDIIGIRSTSETMERVIEQTVEAAQALGWAREGALIVFERRVRLQDVINTGTVLDASVTGELLKSIFFPKAPLHDGAVIVRDARVAGAGCMLPLTNNPNLSKELGMRHRAGVGMSEASDAVVVIVSEETGSISVAMDGMLKRHLMAETLEKLLRGALLPDEGDNKKNAVWKVWKRLTGDKSTES